MIAEDTDLILSCKIILFLFSHFLIIFTHTHARMHARTSEDTKGFNHSSIQTVPDMLKFRPQAWLLEQIFLQKESHQIITCSENQP